MATSSSTSNKVSLWVAVPSLLLATLINVGTFYGAYYYAPANLVPFPQDGDLATKLFFAFRCFLLPVSFLWTTLGLVGVQRTVVGAQNPLTGKEHRMDLSKRQLKNTLEQLTIFAILEVLLACIAEGEEMKLVFLYSMIFVLGRVLFWVGYKIRHDGRVLGTALTFQSMAVIGGICVYKLSSRYFMLSASTALAMAVAVPFFFFISPRLFFRIVS